MLSDSDIEHIDRGAKDLLENPGVKIEDEEIVTRLLQCGARPGVDRMGVRFPREMLQDYLSQAPERFFLANRRGERKEVTPHTSSVFWTAAALFYLDRGGLRLIHRKDLADFSRIVESLSDVDAIVGTSTEEVGVPRGAIVQPAAVSRARHEIHVRARNCLMRCLLCA